MYTRLLNPTPDHSFLLFGPRGTGKTTWIKNKYPNAIYIDLLNSETYKELIANPNNLSSLIPSNFTDFIIIDEVQRVPELLNEVHRLIESPERHKFILTGLYNWMPKTYFGRMQIVSIFDKIPPPIDKPKDEPTCPRCKEKLTYIKTRTIIPKGAYPPQEMIVHDYTCNICNINISFGSRDGNLF